MGGIRQLPLILESVVIVLDSNTVDLVFLYT